MALNPNLFRRNFYEERDVPSRGVSPEEITGLLGLAAPFDQRSFTSVDRVSAGYRDSESNKFVFVDSNRGCRKVSSFFLDRGFQLVVVGGEAFMARGETARYPFQIDSALFDGTNRSGVLFHVPTGAFCAVYVSRHPAEQVEYFQSRGFDDYMNGVMYDDGSYPPRPLILRGDDHLRLPSMLGPGFSGRASMPVNEFKLLLARRVEAAHADCQS